MKPVQEEVYKNREEILARHAETHACNPNYLGGRDLEDHGPRASLGHILEILSEK
jgi:hypothetical protein